MNKIMKNMKSQHWVGLSLFLTFVLTLKSAWIVYLVEGPNPASPINTFFDSLYWALSTVTRIGYGHILPITKLGRVLAVVLATSSVVCSVVCMAWAIAKAVAVKQRHQKL